MLTSLKRRLAQEEGLARQGVDDDIYILRSINFIGLTRAGIERQSLSQSVFAQIAKSVQTGIIRGGKIAYQIGAPIAEANRHQAGGFGVVRYFVLQGKVNSELSLDDACFCHSRLAQIL